VAEAMQYAALTGWGLRFVGVFPRLQDVSEIEAHSRGWFERLMKSFSMDAKMMVSG
jgi:hypothetical protein